MAVSKEMPILIVDDYNTTVRVLRNLLRQLGFSNIDEASDGQTGLVKLRNKHYALVISDADMAPMSGMDLLKHCRAAERYRETPFVMIANDNGEQAQRAGASTYLCKPFTAQSLKTKLEGVLGAF